MEQILQFFASPGSKSKPAVKWQTQLPMKKRYDEWVICRDILVNGLREAGIGFRLKARHPYHDREETTCFIERTG